NARRPSDSRMSLKCENALPVVLHTDYCPAVLLRLVVERLREGAYFRFWKPQGWTVGVFACRVVVQHQPHQRLTLARAGVLQHLLVPSRVAEVRVGPATDHEVNAFSLAAKIIEQRELGLFGEGCLALLVVVELRSESSANNLLGRNAVNLLRP